MGCFVSEAFARCRIETINDAEQDDNAQSGEIGGAETITPTASGGVLDGSVIAVTCIAEVYRIGTPFYVAMFEYSILLWGMPTDTIAMLGIAVIVISGTALTLR